MQVLLIFTNLNNCKLLTNKSKTKLKNNIAWASMVKLKSKRVV